MAESVLLEDSTIYTRAATDDTMAHANGYKPVLDKDLPDITFMTDAEWATFFSIAEAIVPAVVPQTKVHDPMRQLGIPDKEFYAAVDETLASLTNPPSQQKLIEWLAFRAVDEPAFRRECEHSVASAALRMELANFMSMLKLVPGPPPSPPPCPSVAAIVSH